MLKVYFLKWTCTNWCEQFCSMIFFRWTKERAIKFMKKYTNAPTGEVAREIDRYITWPGQACAYKVGELKIRELRQRAETVLGKAMWTHYINDTTALIINTRCLWRLVNKLTIDLPRIPRYFCLATNYQKSINIP